MDSKTGAKVLEQLAELHGAGSTLVMMTTDAASANKATRTLNLVDGRIV
ncbi:hypothetical protein [Corallococcus silvisoli]|nr:hypothetical protein [Corallococcus silvisoli]NBD08796.1 hypothetical protein [Corallococcus silvisoli]